MVFSRVSMGVESGFGRVSIRVNLVFSRVSIGVESGLSRVSLGVNLVLIGSH